MLRISKWKTVCRVEQCQPQEVCAVALMIRILEESNAVSFFRCALNARLLFKMTPRRQGVVLMWTFWVPIKIVGFQVLSLDQVEKGHTSLLSALKFDFHSWLQVTAEFTTEWAAASASSFLRAVVRIEMSSAKREITASSLSEEAM